MLFFYGMGMARQQTGYLLENDYPWNLEYKSNKYIIVLFKYIWHAKIPL